MTLPPAYSLQSEGWKETLHWHWHVPGFGRSDSLGVGLHALIWRFGGLGDRAGNGHVGRAWACIMNHGIGWSRLVIMDGRDAAFVLRLGDHWS